MVADGEWSKKGVTHCSSSSSLAFFREQDVENASSRTDDDADQEKRSRRKTEHCWWHIIERNFLLCWSLICLPFVRSRGKPNVGNGVIRLPLSLSFFLSFFLSLFVLQSHRVLLLSNAIVVVVVVAAAGFVYMYSHQDDDLLHVLSSSSSFLYTEMDIRFIRSPLRWIERGEREGEKGRTFANTAI